MRFSLNGFVRIQRVHYMVEIKILHGKAVIPKRMTEGAACADLTVVFHDGYKYDYLSPGETKIFKVGFSVAVPEGYEMQIRSRSGLASIGIIVSNGVGTIDSDYRGEVGVILTNTSDTTRKICEGDRIAQCCLKQVLPLPFVEVDLLSSTKRGDGGYGHTG